MVTSSPWKCSPHWYPHCEVWTSSSISAYSKKRFLCCITWLVPMCPTNTRITVAVPLLMWISNGCTEPAADSVNMYLRQWTFTDILQGSLMSVSSCFYKHVMHCERVFVSLFPIYTHVGYRNCVQRWILWRDQRSCSFLCRLSTSATCKRNSTICASLEAKQRLGSIASTDLWKIFSYEELTINVWQSSDRQYADVLADIRIK